MLVSTTSPVGLGATNVALDCKLVEGLGAAIAAEVSADDLENLMAFQSEAGFTLVKELEERLFESGVEDQGIEVIDVALIHKIESINEELQLVHKELMQVVRRPKLESFVFSDDGIVNLARLWVRIFEDI